jgi:hypothetical protein
MQQQVGDFFGDEALTGATAKHGVRATEPCSLLVLLTSDLLGFLERYPDLREQILRSRRKMLVRKATPKNLQRLIQPSNNERLSKLVSSSLPVSLGPSSPKSEAEPLVALKLPEAYDEFGDHDILLIRAEWLILQWQTGRRLERRQNLPPEAFYPGKLELRTLVVISCALPRPCHTPPV